MRWPFALLIVSACGRYGFERVAPDGSEPDFALDAAPPNTVVQISIGAFTSCARLASGAVWCWGEGEGGSLGDGDVGPHTTSVPVRALQSGVVELDTNDGGSLARLAEGTVVAWGPNTDGAFGLGDNTPRGVPTAIPNISDARAMTLTYNAACIARASGPVQCAGNFALLAADAAPTRFAFGDGMGLLDVTALTGGDDHMCALHATGAVSCWGLDDQGQLGVAGPAPHGTPVVASTGPYVQVAAGDRFTCALRPTGVVDCWGANGNGALGDGTTNQRSSPAAVLGITTATMISCAAETGCALLADGNVVCWGANFERALGDATPMYRAFPGPPVIGNVREIAAQSSTHTCAVKRDNTVWCWGPNYRGQLGNPIADGVIGPVQVLGLP